MGEVTMKLYLGCAMPPFHEQHLGVMGDPEEWTWVDLFVSHPKIKKWDASTLEEVEDGTVEKIYASHLLEHLEHGRLPEILGVWNRKLKEGGKIVLNVPDLVWLCEQVEKFEKGETLGGYYYRFDGEHGLLSVAFGSQSHPGEYHKSAFTSRSLRELLEKAGFKEISISRVFEAHDMGCLIAEAVK